MPSNYVGVASNFTLGPVTVAEPIDGDSDNGASFQTPMSTIADVLAALVDRADSLLYGPAVPRATTTAFALSMNCPPTFASSLGALGLGRTVLLGAAGATTPICQTTDDLGVSYATRASFATSFGTDLPSACAWNGSLFVAVGSTGKISTSADGITWAARTSTVATALSSVAWSPANSLWIVGGASTVVLTSPDGITWTSRATGQTAGTVSVTWGAGPGLFVAVTTLTGTTANSIATSPTGVTWTLRAAPVANMMQVNYAAFSTPVYVLPSVTNLYTSLDGINWTSRSAVSGAGVLSSFVFTGRSALLMSGGSSSFALTSRDGVTWVQRPLAVAVGTAAATSVGAFAALGGVWYSYAIVTGNGGLAAGPLLQFP